jgi:hypothetical protein
MGRRSQRQVSSYEQAGQVGEIEREAIERRWHRRMTRDERLASLVTGRALREEPFHRWMPYKQAFAPELVRTFLQQTQCGHEAPGAPPILDPFSGAGTVAIECARRGVRATGIESIDVLAFLARARGVRDVPPVPDLSGCSHWRQVADRLEHEAHRAALILAVARMFTSDGRPKDKPPKLSDAFVDCIRTMRQDLKKGPLPLSVCVEQGDARDLSRFADGSMAGVITSPPYLSRHDYTVSTRPHERVYRHWYGGRGESDLRDEQIRAHDRAHQQTWSEEMPAVVRECCEALGAAQQSRVSGVVRSYFQDMFGVLREARRVLRPDAPCWIIVGGARLKNVYVPADLILASAATDLGFDVEELRIARDLIASGRKLGALPHVTPRETILMLRRCR